MKVRGGALLYTFLLLAFAIGLAKSGIDLGGKSRTSWVDRTMLRALFIGLPALTFALGIPLVLKLVPPNRFYGFRTTTSYSSADAWYQLNFATGLALVVAGIVAGLLVLFLSHGPVTLKSEVRYLVGIFIHRNHHIDVFGSCRDLLK